MIGVPTDRMVSQPHLALTAPSNPTASTEPICLRVQQLSGNRIHAGNGRAFRSLTARGGGFALDEASIKNLVARGRTHQESLDNRLITYSEEPGLDGKSFWQDKVIYHIKRQWSATRLES
jgi:hypothetical protein